MNVNYRMNQIIGSEADWANNNLVLGEGEIALSIQADGQVLGKIGDGASPFSALDFTIGVRGIPLEGTDTDAPVTGLLVFKNDTVNKQYTFGILEGFSTDDMILASTGANVANSTFRVSINSLTWSFGPTGRLTGPDIVYGAGDTLVYANKKYVDAAVAGGVAGTYLPLSGNPSTPMSGAIYSSNSTLNKQYTTGIIAGSGIDNYTISATGANKINCSFLINMNDYLWWFRNTGRLELPDIVYGAGDTLAATNKKYVDAALAVLRAEIVAAGVVL